MSQHYTRLTIETSAWCNKCGKNTPHRVADKRLQYCLACFDKSAEKSKLEREKSASPVAMQERLF